MTEKRGRPLGTTRVHRIYSSIKIDKEILSLLKLIAAKRNKTVAELASEMLRGPAETAFQEMLRAKEEEMRA